MLVYFGMNLTMREELTILSLCFIFSAITIPIVIVTSNEYRQNKVNSIKIDNTPMRIPPISTYRDKVLVNAVQIIENFNQNHTSDQISFIKLLKMKPYELGEKYLTLSHTTATKGAKILQKNTDSNNSGVWRQFSFQNGTLLTSKSTAIPLTVDW